MEITEVTGKPEYAASAESRFAIDVLVGLSSKPKRLMPKYFYDDRGSEIFQAITQHPDYYPTDCEFEILEKRSRELASAIDVPELDVIELGAGDGHKTQLLLNGLLPNKKIHFYPIDISAKAMDLLDVNIARHPNLEVHGVVGEYFEGLRFLHDRSSRPQLVVFLGSNIGNMDSAGQVGFFRQLWQGLDDGDHVISGFDLKKDIRHLVAAYNDSGGHTADFNLNLLTRINRELGANFDLDGFCHIGIYNPILGAMESFLISKKQQTVDIHELDKRFSFEEQEAIHMEYSFKFRKADIEALADETGFEVVRHLTDSKDFFADSLWRVRKAT